MAERDLSTLKFTAEMISAVAIIISLLYVGYEIRQTQVLSQRSVDELLFARNQESNRVLIENPDFAEIFVRARRDPDSLSEAERVRYLAFEHNMIDNWEIAFYAHYDGVLSEEYWAEWDDYYRAQMQRRPRYAWTENRHLFVGPFAEYVDEFMEEEYRGN